MKWGLQDWKRVCPNRSDVQRVVQSCSLLAVGTMRPDAGRVDFQMCPGALTYVRWGVCTVGAGVGCLLSWLKEFKCWFSLRTLSISLLTASAGIINPLLGHSSFSTPHIACLLFKLTSWMKTNRHIMTGFHNFLANWSRTDSFNLFVVQTRREVGLSIAFSLHMSWHGGLGANRAQR